MRGDAERPRRAWPATVWPTGQLADASQDGTGDGVTADRAVSPVVAAHAIAVYSRPGDTVCDPHCTDGTVVAEAVQARRHAIGIATDPHAWQTARATLTAAKARGAPGDGMILDRPPERWSWTGLGPVDLLLTALGPSADPSGVEGPQGDGLSIRLAGYRDLARPAGRLVVVAAHHVAGGLDLASRIIAAGREAGWRPVQRAVALTATTHTGAVAAHPPASDRAWPAHHDVIIFEGGSERAPQPRPPGRSPSHPTSVADPPIAAVL